MAFRFGDERVYKPSPDWVPRSEWKSPESLFLYAANVVDEEPLPECFSWKNLDVVKWIDRLGFPEYRRTFHDNMINGRTLLLVDANALCRMNIRYFDHIRIIAKAIRDLYNVEKIVFNRSISLPSRYARTEYFLYRVYTGPKYENLPPSQFYRQKIANYEPEINYNYHHYDILKESMIWKPCLGPRSLIGGIPRFQLYRTKRGIGLEKVQRPCHCVPPCECEWPDSWYDTRRKILKFADECDLEMASLEEGDLVIVTDEENKETEIHCNCNCIPPCQCDLSDKELKSPRVLSVIRFLSGMDPGDG